MFHIECFYMYLAQGMTKEKKRLLHITAVGLCVCGLCLVELNLY